MRVRDQGQMPKGERRSNENYSQQAGAGFLHCVEYALPFAQSYVGSHFSLEPRRRGRRLTVSAGVDAA